MNGTGESEWWRYEREWFLITGKRFKTASPNSSLTRSPPCHRSCNAGLNKATKQRSWDGRHNKPKDHNRPMQFEKNQKNDNLHLKTVEFEGLRTSWAGLYGLEQLTPTRVHNVITRSLLCRSYSCCQTVLAVGLFWRKIQEHSRSDYIRICCKQESWKKVEDFDSFEIWEKSLMS